MACRRLDRLARHLNSGDEQRKFQLVPEATISRGDYDRMYNASTNDRESFWSGVADGIDWVRRYTSLVDESRKPFSKWFVGGQLSVCHNAVDRHVAVRGDQPAVIYDSPVTGTIQSISYRQLQQTVAKVAGALQSLGVQTGDRIIVYMPMIPEAIYAMLGSARLGAIHSVVFGGFAAPELAARIDDAGPVAILAASCGIEAARVIEYMPLLMGAVELAKTKPRHILVKQRAQGPKVEMVSGKVIDWDQAISAAAPADCVPVDSNAPLYILYTSGSTGKPKGVLRDSAPHAAALNWSMPNFMKTGPGETFWAASDVGWVVGHSYIVYAPLLQGCTTVLYEGKPVGTPDAGAFWRVIQDHKVRGFFTAPTALRAIRKEDPNLELMKKYDLSGLRAFFVAGERCDPATCKAYSSALGFDVIDNWWQTETGWPICGFQDDEIGMKSGSCSLPFPGYNLVVMDDNGAVQPRGTVGTLAVKLPLPPSCFPTLWNNDKGFVEGYMELFPGYYASGDAGVIDEDGYVTVLERTDDVINVAAHRLSTGRIEAVVKACPGVSDAAVVGAQDQQKGQVPLALVVLNAEGTSKEKETLDGIRAAVRAEIGAIASLQGLAAVEQLPKTRSGKVLRKNIRGIADGKPVAVPGTIENPQALDICAAALLTIGYPKLGSCYHDS